MWHMRNGDEPLPEGLPFDLARSKYSQNMALFKTTMWKDGIPQAGTMLATGTINRKSLKTLLTLGQQVIAHAFPCHGVSAVKEWKLCAKLLEDGHRYDGLKASTKNTIRSFMTMAENIIMDSEIEDSIKQRLLPAIRRGGMINKEAIECLGNNLSGILPARSERYATFGHVLDALEETGRLKEISFKPGVIQNLGKRRAEYYDRKWRTY